MFVKAEAERDTQDLYLIWLKEVIQINILL